MSSFIFTHPDFNNVECIGWWREALTFAVEVKFTDGATAKASLSGVGFQALYDKAEAARISWIELCPFCKAKPGSHRWTMEGDVITICKDCAEVEEF